MRSGTTRGFEAVVFAPTVILGAALVALAVESPARAIGAAASNDFPLGPDGSHFAPTEAEEP